MSLTVITYHKLNDKLNMVESKEIGRDWKRLSERERASRIKEWKTQRGKGDKDWCQIYCFHFHVQQNNKVYVVFGLRLSGFVCVLSLSLPIFGIRKLKVFRLFEYKWNPVANRILYIPIRYANAQSWQANY